MSAAAVTRRLFVGGFLDRDRHFPKFELLDLARRGLGQLCENDVAWAFKGCEVLSAPSEQFLVGAALLGAVDDGVIGDAEQLDAGFVKALAQIGGVVGRKLAGGVQADFIEHAGEIDEAFDGVIRTAGKERGHRS